jgi:exosortase
LQLLASRIATDLAQAIGVSIFRDGTIIHLANTSLGVEEACSGLHSLPALMVGSLLLGFLANATMTGRILLLLISIPLAIAVNVLRVTGTAILADFRPEFAEGFYHSFSGWLVFVGGFGALWLIGQLFFKWTRKKS